MDARTLLLITYHFPPSAAAAVYRMLGLARHLPRFGWNVIVVAPPRMHGEPEDANLLRLVPDSTTVVRVPLPSGLLGKFGRRISGNLAWAPGALSACQRILHRYQPHAILTSSPPPDVHYLGLYLKKRYGVPWVASLRDPWVTNRVLPLKGSRTWNRFMEGRMVRHADAVVANTPLNLTGLQAMFPDHADKMTSIPNGFEPSWFPPAPARDRDRATLSLLHAGELYSGRDPRPLLDALVQLERESPAEAPRFNIRFLGRATEGLCDLPAEIARRGLLGAVEEQAPYRESLRRMVAADVLLLLHTAQSRVGAPAKLYEYLGAGRPILAIAEPEGDVAWVLRESGVSHRLARSGDSPGILRALRELREEILLGNARSEALHLNPFTRENMARRAARCLDWACTPARLRSVPALPQLEWQEESALLNAPRSSSRARALRAEESQDPFAPSARLRRGEGAHG